MTPANDNKPRLACSAITGEVIELHRNKQQIADAMKAERAAMRKQKVRLGKRAKIGADWDGRADNDNINWPLATSLIREGNTELLKAAVAYRRIHAQANSGAVLGGGAAVLREGMSLDRHIHLRENGTIAYKHARQSEAASVEFPAKMKVKPYANDEDGVERNAVRVPKPWNGDQPVNDMIDAQGKLSGLRHRLGVLVEPLEMAVIDGATYQQVGNASGVADRSGSISAGRAVVHLALLSVRDALGNVRRQDLAA